jgi:hypothetical protein
MAECGDNYFTPDENTAVNTGKVAGEDFLAISDTSTHVGLDCYMIYCDQDTVFNDIVVGGVNVVTAKGLSGVTVHQGTLLPFGKVHATAIDLASGAVIAYIY